jgi:hypothetical protein
MKVKKIVFKVGDSVKIINPEIFIRCGYPWSKKYVEENIITPEERQKIANLLGYEFVELVGDRAWKSYSIILGALAYNKLRANNFGGRERSIYTENRTELKDKIFKVSGKKTVKTGKYVSGSCYEDDYEPAYLECEKTHVILSVYDDDFICSDFQIEEKNVEKVDVTINKDEY